MKKEYTIPVLEDLGSVRELTLANTGGSIFDQSFNVGDPIPPNITS